MLARMISLLALALLPSCVAVRVSSQSIWRRRRTRGIFADASSHVAVAPADASSHVAGKTSCALLCHLPPPWHEWRHAWASKCDMEKSLFLDSDQSPSRQLKETGVSAEDLVQVVHRAMFTYEGQREPDKTDAPRYQILKDDLDVAQGVLFGAVLDVEESETNWHSQGTVTPWQGTVNSETRCIAVAALDEVRRLTETRFQLNASEYIEKRRRDCSVSSTLFVGKRALNRSKAALDKANHRCKMIAESGGKAKLLSELDQRLPPASTPCNGTLEECLPSRFVNISQWQPPATFEHQYDNVIFAGCSWPAMTHDAVVTAMKLVAPGGNIIVSHFTPQELSEKFGVNSFDVLSKAGWTHSIIDTPWNDDGITVQTLTTFTPP